MKGVWGQKKMCGNAGKNGKLAYSWKAGNTCRHVLRTLLTYSLTYLLHGAESFLRS